VADSVNPIALTREAWRNVATRSDVAAAEIEVRCSDVAEHRARIESRTSDIAGLRLPTWADVQAREYEPSDPQQVVIIDTAGRTTAQSFDALKRALTL